MTGSRPKAAIRRAIQAAKAAGLRVTAIFPDGTVAVTESSDPVPVVVKVVLAPEKKRGDDFDWSDARVS